MTNRATWGAVIWLLLVPTAARAQGSPSSGSQTLDTLLNEVRLLRQAIERQSTRATRTQLLVGRLSLQDQRVARSRATVEQLETDLTSAERERGRMRTDIGELHRALAQATETARRGPLEQEIRASQARLRDHDTNIADLQSRHVQAKQILEAETGRFDELESWFNQLERELDRPTR